MKYHVIPDKNAGHLPVNRDGDVSDDGYIAPMLGDVTALYTEKQ